MGLRGNALVSQKTSMLRDHLPGDCHLTFWAIRKGRFSNLSFSAFSESIEETEDRLFFNSNFLELHSTRKALPLSGL
jgi:hypothetical protein